MKFKKTILILIILFMTGCSVNADISINGDLSLSESINIEFKNSLANASESITEYAENYLNYYASAIELKNYNYVIKEGSNNSNVIFNKTSKDICVGINEGLFSNYLYDKIECSNTEDYIIIVSKGTPSTVLATSQKKFNVEKVNLNLKLPIRPIEHNADVENNNVYTWNFNKYITKDKIIYLKIDKHELEKYNENLLIKQNKQNKQNKINIIIAIFSILGVLVVISVILLKKYKKNKLEY